MPGTAALEHAQLARARSISRVVCRRPMDEGRGRDANDEGEDRAQRAMSSNCLAARPRGKG
eukprot:13944706-Alexandrium_andersonii.AAC.1